MQVGGCVKGPGGLDPLHWTYGVGVLRVVSSIIVALCFLFFWPAVLDSLDGLEPRVRFLILNSTFHLVLIHLSTLYRRWVRLLAQPQPCEPV
ncbi:hypothetical protein BDW72DRAFT_52536 [Aspergillus terricola var. indicus]